MITVGDALRFSRFNDTDSHEMVLNGCKMSSVNIFVSYCVGCRSYGVDLQQTIDNNRSYGLYRVDKRIRYA